MIRLNKKTTRILKGFFVVVLVISWLITGWPPISIGPQFRFPPKIKETQAAVAHDASSHDAAAASGATTNFSWTHTPVGTPKGVIVLVVQSTLSTDQVSSVTYGALTLTRVARACDTATEPGCVYAYFGGSSVPTGAQTVTVNVSGSSGKHASAITLTAAGNTEVVTSDATITADATNPTVTLNLGGRTSFVAEGVYSGVANVTSITPFTGWTSRFEDDFGAFVDGYYTYDTVGSTNVSAGWTQATDDAAMVALAVSEITTTIGSGTDPATTTVAPGSAIVDAGAFTVQTTSGTDSITALTVTLAAAGTPYNGLSEVRVTSDNGATLYFAAISNPASNTLNFSGGTAIPATTTSTQFKIRVTPKTHANMAVPPGASYDLSPYVSALTTTNPQSGSDSNANTLTVDNASPNGATLTSGSAGDTKVTLNWTTSNSSDFATTNGSVILRWAAATAGSEIPAEGTTSYTAGNTIGTSTVACVISSSGSTAQSKVDGTGGSVGCTTTALANGQAYTYKVFQVDTNGNYDVGVTIGTFTPSAASSSFTQNKYRWYIDNDLADPTTAWGTPALAENTAITTIPAGKDPPDTTQELRLRVNYTVNTANLPISSNYFKLEYKAGTDGSCTTGTWTDVGTGGWAYTTSTVTDGANITASLSDTTVGKGQQYAKSKPTALNHVAANTTEIIEYDFHIIGSTATANTTYSFRVVGTNSAGTTETVFDAYTNCPTLNTEPGVSDLMRHGNVFTNGSEQGFFWAN